MNGRPSANGGRDETIWALKDVSFEVKRGEVVGVIGRNGAGKTTLLKILSRITEPTEGRAEIHGRVGSLLEVGTGFHPELTGWENIYLNGAILGMTKVEIDRKFDEIVAFTEIEKFIDTPVKRYSSGMYVRLAFAVAAHLEPEILLVDEVLAVGDAGFQKKCLGKIAEVAGENRTVVFVSHNVAAIAQLCQRTLLLAGGQLKLIGPSSDVVGCYLSSGTVAHAEWERRGNGTSAQRLEIRSARVLAADASAVGYDAGFALEIRYDITQPLRNAVVLSRVTDWRGNVLWTSWDTDTTTLAGTIRECGEYVSICKVPGRLLGPGRYFVSVGALVPAVEVVAYHEHVISFAISEAGCTLNRGRIGALTPLLAWDVEKL